MAEVKIFDDLFCIVVAETEEYTIHFNVYSLEWEGQKPSVEELENSESMAEGYVKWDGCSEWDIKGWHSCSKKNLKDISEILSRCWDMAGTLCPNWNP